MPTSDFLEIFGS